MLEHDATQTLHARTIVEMAGGVWVGLQHTFVADHPLVLFRSGGANLMSLPYDEFFTVNAVQEKMNGR